MGSKQKTSDRLIAGFLILDDWGTEREGFEPSLKLPLNSISSAAPSTTRPPLHRSVMYSDLYPQESYPSRTA
jgi:hypothetical protein